MDGPSSSSSRFPAVIDRSKHSPDVLYAFGHGHVGMASSGMTGMVVADLIGGRPPTIDLAPFGASRFGCHSFNQEFSMFRPG